MISKHIIIAICITCLCSSYSDLYKDKYKLLIYAVINDNFEIVGNNPSWLIGSCVELKIDTVDMSRVNYFKKKNGVRMVEYRGCNFYKEQFFNQNKLEYLKSLEISKIYITQTFGFEPPNLWFKSNCITKDEEKNRIKYIVDEHKKKGTKRTFIAITPLEVKDEHGNIVNIKLNSVHYFMYPKMDID
ncbi:MAG: hypothetical protein BroJett020_02330 [Bacteroidota bacterium]|nr:MAG: hypothetical protein BroJett020_02330 [Bacteroidota bacterium]